jgi:hypothetical protein
LDIVRLGEVVVPTRTVAILDAGLLGTWERDRDRLARALKRHKTVPSVAFTIGEGATALAVRSLPSAGPYPVLGEELTGDYEGNFRRVWLEIQKGKPTKSREFGVVDVDCARLILADPQCLDVWSHDEPLDGKADVTFWGLDAAKLAKTLRAPALEDDEYGWKDLLVDDAVELARKVEQTTRTRDYTLASEIRPHSHHGLILDQFRTSPSQSAMLDLDGGRVCAFHTRWGDGHFPVVGEFDAKGEILRITVEFVGEEDE